MTITATGLQYEDTKEGTGATAAKGQSVTVHYTGWLYNNGTQGAKFDSSKDRNDPFVFQLGAGMVMGQTMAQAMQQGLQPPAAAAAPAPVVAMKPDEVMATLEKLADLKAKGILTEDEFSAKKTELLKKLV